MSTMMTTDRPRGSFSFSSEFLCSGLTLADVGADAKPVAAPTQAPESPEAPVATIPTEVTDHSVVLVETDPTEATPPAADDLEGAREALARYELALERCWSLNLELTAAQGELETAEGEEAVTAAHEKVAAAQLPRNRPVRMSRLLRQHSRPMARNSATRSSRKGRPQQPLPAPRSRGAAAPLRKRRRFSLRT